MEDMEKNLGETGTEETEVLELNSKMMDRADWIDGQTYWYLLQLLELEVKEAEEKFPRNIEILRRVFDSTVYILLEYGHAVCNPYVAESENGRQYRCTPSECGCKSCNCQNQDEFMEKERLLCIIEDAVEENGLKIIDSGEDSITVKESRTDKDFEIRVRQLAA